MALAADQPMNRTLPILYHGHYEGLKAGVHGVAMGVAALCAVYNLAAWVARRQRHSAVNAGLYTAVVAWEWTHVQHHIRCRPARATTVKGPRAVA